MDTTRTWLAMAMPTPFHLDTLPSHLCLSTPLHLAKHEAKDPRRSPVQALDREDDDRTRTTRAQVRPGTPRAAWATSLAHGRARHGHAAPAKSCRTPTISARRSTSLATRSSPDTLASCLSDHGRRRGRARPPLPRQYMHGPDHPTPPLAAPFTLLASP
jgi:hypothetical protein